LALVGTEDEVAPDLAEAAASLRALADNRDIDEPTRQAMYALLSAAEEAQQRLAAQDARIRQLLDLSVTDELTGLLNRRGFLAELRRALARSRRSGETGMVLLCDLDRFKAINDTYGHPAGDAALIVVAQLLQSNVRGTDSVARLGGDEFAVLLADACTRAVKPRIDSIKDKLSGLIVDCGGVHVPLSASVGHAKYGPNSDCDLLISMADKALYRAKTEQPHRIPPTASDRGAIIHP
jgi:diguanylate cyclase (GGDEF)-like protein